MRASLRGCALLLAMGVSSLASAAAPTPQALGDIQRLLGLDVVVDHLIAAKFDNAEELASLAPEQKECLSGSLRAQVLDSGKGDLAQLFVDQETVAEWLRFAGTTGGSKMMEALRGNLTAAVTGLPRPDIAAVEASLTSAEKVDVFLFANSPAGQVVKKKFPDAKPVDTAELEAAVQRCGLTSAQR